MHYVEFPMNSGILPLQRRGYQADFDLRLQSGLILVESCRIRQNRT
jgi:hypothetical protein